MPTLTQLLTLTKNFLIKQSKLRPRVAIVLGSGLAEIADAVEEKTEVAYKDIPNFPMTSVVGHRGQIVFGRMQGVGVIVFDGRLHFYEGLPMQQVAFPAYVAAQLGASAFIVTNAAGGINEEYAPGDLMVIRDHLNLTGDNPLRGPNFGQLGARFVAMRDAYDPELFALALKVAAAEKIKLHQGIYAAVAGPTYETDAELRMLRVLGADAVGMSTVPEVIAARHAGMRVFGLSVIANDASPQRAHAVLTVDHESVGRVVSQSAPKARAIIEGVIAGL